MSEASAQHDGGDGATDPSSASAAAHPVPEPADGEPLAVEAATDDDGEPVASEPATDDRGPKWSDLRQKPVLQWTKEDWALWAGGPTKSPAASPTEGPEEATEPGTTPGIIGRPAGDEGADRSVRPRDDDEGRRTTPPSKPVEAVAEPEVEPAPGAGTVRPFLGDLSPGQAQNPERRLAAAPSAAASPASAPSAPASPGPATASPGPATASSASPASQAPASRVEAPRRKAEPGRPSGPPRARRKPAAARPRGRRSGTAAPTAWLLARLPRTVPSAQLASTIRLVALSVMVGVVLAGVITAALVITGIALSQALD